MTMTAEDITRLLDEIADPAIAKLLASRANQHATKLANVDHIAVFKNQFPEETAALWTARGKVRDALTLYNDEKGTRLRLDLDAEKEEDLITTAPKPSDRKPSEKVNYANLFALLLPQGYGPEIRMRPYDNADHVEAIVLNDGQVKKGEQLYPTPSDWMTAEYEAAKEHRNDKQSRANPLKAISIKKGDNWSQLEHARNLIEA